ncbi:MAG: hypothetical protein C0598_03040 [Marinilabiliales bacterium]|nr:MAG: hypothetical protein C0598_03040 [Marinilabiliales bacterium]
MIKSYSFTYSSTDEISIKLNNALKDMDFKPTLAFCFISVDMQIKPLMKEFDNNGIKLFGASSCGEFLLDDKQEIISEKSAVITLTDIPEDNFDIICKARGDEDSKIFGNALGDRINKCKYDASVIIAASGLTLDGQALVEGIIEKNSEDLIMYGGLAGDDSMFEGTYVFTEKEILENGSAMLLLNKDKIHISGIASSGWIGLGADLKVTKSENNIVYTIDDKPALDVYKSYLSVTDEELPAIGVEFPLMIKRQNGQSALRAVVGIDRDERSLIFAGSVPENSIVTFSSSPGFEVVQTTTSKLEGFYKEDSEADLFILFSCMARHLALGPMVNQEIKYASETWKAPIIGFFTYGEIGMNSSNNCDFFNQTYTLVKLKSKN